MTSKQSYNIDKEEQVIPKAHYALFHENQMAMHPAMSKQLEEVRKTMTEEEFDKYLDEL